MDIILTPEEVRVLGSLMEKEMTTPEYYPLSLNALINACNQKTSRFPVVNYDERLVLGVLSRLQEKRFVWQSDASRVSKYEQLFAGNHNLIAGEAAVLCVLMLRGPQTLGEIKAHTERLHDFPDMESLGNTLTDLVDAGYIMKMNRLPGRKESRYTHLFSGMPEDTDSIGISAPVQASPVSTEDLRISRVEEELAALRRDFDDLRLRITAFMEQFK